MERNNYCRHWAANALEGPASADHKDTESPSFGSKTNNNKAGPSAGNIDGLWIYCYPNTGINCYEPAWYSMRVVPLESNKTRLEYEIFSKKGVEEGKIQEFIAFLQQVEKEVGFLASLFRVVGWS